MPKRALYGRAAIPTSRNDGNSIDRPRDAYNCVDRSPRLETQRPTLGYTAIEVAWLAMYTAKIPAPMTSHATPRAKPATQPIAAMRLTSASRAGHSDSFDVSIKRTVPAGPLAAPRKPARRFAK